MSDILFFNTQPKKNHYLILYQAHFDSHCSSEIARFNMGAVDEHQRDAWRIFRSDRDNNFSIGEHVLIKNKRSTFHKTSIFTPTFSSDVFVIKMIDKKKMPFIYHLSKESSDTVTKRLYAFEMMKFQYSPGSSQLNPKLGVNENQAYERFNTVNVIDVVLRQPTQLRSGRIIGDKSLIFYRIESDGKQDIVSEKGLRFLKNAIGSSIKYSDFFKDPSKQKYMI